MWQLLLIVHLLASLDGSPLQEEPSASSSNNGAAPMHSPSTFQHPSNFTKTGDWGDLADSYVCSDGSATGVRDALHEFYPTYDFFVLLTNPGSGYFYSTWTSDETHRRNSICGVDMFVWRRSGSTTSCSSSLMAQAQFLIDAAAGESNDPETIVNAIDEGDLYGFLSPFFTEFLFYRRRDHQQ